MICARCNEPMEASKHRGVPTSTCPKCAGIWVSGESSHQIILREPDAPAVERALESMFNLEFDESMRRCPSCVDKRLKTVFIENTELDFCVSCKGLYFDRGELDRVYPGRRRVEPVEFDHADDAESEKSIWRRLKNFFRAD